MNNELTETEHQLEVVSVRLAIARAKTLLAINDVMARTDEPEIRAIVTTDIEMREAEIKKTIRLEGALRSLRQRYIDVKTELRPKDLQAIKIIDAALEEKE